MDAGQGIRLIPLEDGFAELWFDRQDGAINRFDEHAVVEPARAAERLAATIDLRGVLVTSAKDRGAHA